MKFLLLLLFPACAWAAHGYSQFGELKYKPGFANFEWVNPAAPISRMA